MIKARLISFALAASITSSFAITAPGAASSVRTAPVFTPNMAFRVGLSPAARGVAADVAVLRDGRFLGRAPQTTPIHIGILMRAQHEDEMRALAAAQGTKGSRYYRRFINAQQFARYFAPSTETIRRIELRLGRAGFRGIHTNANRTIVSAVAPAAVAGRFFRTSFAVTRQTGREMTYANTTAAIVPADMKNDIVSVAGLHSFRTVHSYMQHLTPEARTRLAARTRAFHATPVANAVVTAPQPALATPTANPRPINETTAKPGPAATDTVETPNSDLSLAGGQGYGPPIFSTAYDYPTQHGYNGTGRAAGSVIDVDYSDDDLKKELTQYGLPPRVAGTVGAANNPAGTNEYRVCYDGTNAGTTPTASCQLCVPKPTANGTNCDADGESGLDAEAIMTMAPGAAFYEFIAPGFSDAQLEQAYETAVAQDTVDAVNSSFGGCETDDPGFEYSADYIGLEGALEGITFSASTGDTGGESCGMYVTNGVPQTFTNVSSPAGANYFVGVGGTSFDTLLSCTGATATAAASCYTSEQGWLEGGGGSSVLIGPPTWQAAAISAASAANMDITTGRDIPDVSLTADGGVNFIGGTQGNGLIICSSAISAATPCSFTGSGGTSLSSPLFVALQTEINQVTNSRNGWVNPRLYAVAVANPGYAFRDLIVGNNERYNAGMGYDMSTGIGSPLGFSLASSE